MSLCYVSHFHLGRLFILTLAVLLLSTLIDAELRTANAQYLPAQTITSDSPDVDDFFGRAIADVGTVSGVPVLIVGAPGDADQGRAYLVNRNDGTIRSTLSSPDGTFEGRFGDAVGIVGDLTGDGFPDVVVGAPLEDPTVTLTNAGVAYVFDGDTGAFVREIQTPTSSPDFENERLFGAAVAGIGDINGDGSPDILIGAPEQDASGASRAGKAYIFNGSDGSLINVLTGAEEDTGLFGTAVADVGDLVGDSTPDFAIGAPRENVIDGGGDAVSEAGKVYIFDGATLNPTVVISGNVESGGQFGRSIASLGTTDPRDLVIGAFNEDGGGLNGAGRAYIIDGANLAGTPITLESTNPQSSAAFGIAVDGLTDIDGDNLPDVLVGAPEETISGTINAGRAYIFSSADGSVIATLTSPSLEDGRFGRAVAGSQYPIVGAPEENVSTSVGLAEKAGRIHRFTPSISLVDGRDGEPYAPPTASGGVDENSVGRFRLSAGGTGAALTSLTVTNAAATPSGANSVELWSSADNTFDASSDTEVASVSYSDAASFSGLDVEVAPDITYYFIVVGTDASVNGDYEPVIMDETRITFANGTLTEYNGAQTSVFTDAFLSDSATPLPVELAGFSAQLTNGSTVVLQWQTLSETNNSRFDLQRRETTQQTWRTIGTVEGAGTTNDPQQYRFSDGDLPYTASSMTYRLKQIDVDGGEDILSTVEVTLDAPQQVELLGTNPNPARARVTARLAVPQSADAESVRLRLYDILGRQVRSFDGQVRTGQRQEVSLDLSGLASGTYLLRLSAGGSSQTQRVTVVR